MADKYVAVFFDWPEATRELNDQEKGRLIDAIVVYARGDGDWQDRIKGNERYVFPMFQAQIDRASAQKECAAQAHREAGKAGGRPKTKQNQNNQNGFSETKSPNKYKYKDEYKDEYKDKDEYTTPLPPPGEVSTAAAYAMEILPRLIPKQMEELTSFRVDLPDELICHALDIAADNTRSWAYVKGILNRYMDEGVRTLGDALAQEAKWKQEKRNGVGPANAKEPNPALNYQQRDYHDEDFGDDFFEDLTKYAEEA